MRFAPDEEETMIRDMLDRLLRDAREGAARCDGHAPRPDPEALRHQLAELGLWGGWLPEHLGGTDGGARLLMVLARGLGGNPSHCDLIGGCVLPACLLAQSEDEQAHETVGLISTGEISVAAALLEPGKRWDLTPSSVRAEPAPGGFRLVGQKAHIPDAVGANYFVISAAEEGGVSLFLLPAETPGLSISHYPATDGSIWAMLRLDDVTLPTKARVIGPGEGLAALEHARALAGFAAAAEILGSCSAALDQTLEYLRTREQFGRPLASNQALQFRAADLHTDIEMLRSLVLGAANSLGVMPADCSPRSYSDAAAAMATALETGDRVAREAIHLHGAIGMTRELGIGYHLLRLDVIARWLGDSAHFRNLFLTANELEDVA